jgi:hypothetical protein
MERPRLLPIDDHRFVDEVFVKRARRLGSGTESGGGVFDFEAEGPVRAADWWLALNVLKDDVVFHD